MEISRKQAEIGWFSPRVDRPAHVSESLTEVGNSAPTELAGPDTGPVEGVA